MFLDDFNGEVIITSTYELIESLERRYLFDSNYFILTFEESGFPQLSIFVKNDECVIYYMEINQSFISLNGMPEEGTTLFYENTGGAEVELPNQSKISVDKMKEVSIEFFKQQRKPLTIEWLEI